MVEPALFREYGAAPQRNLRLYLHGYSIGVPNIGYRGDSGHALDESQCRTHRILKVDADDIPFLRELDPDMDTLEAFQGYAGMKDRQRLLRWQMENQVSRDVGHILENVTPHKFMRYMDGQYAALRLRDGHRYSGMQSIVSEYRDYLDMCAKLGYDIGNGFVLYPKYLREAHDEAVRHVKAKADARMRRDFEQAMEAVAGHLDFTAEGIKIILPNAPEELAAEGHALHHCVGGYASRVAKNEVLSCC